MAEGGGNQEHRAPILWELGWGDVGVGRDLAEGSEQCFLILASGQDLEDRVGVPAPAWRSLSSSLL